MWMGKNWAGRPSQPLTAAGVTKAGSDQVIRAETEEGGGQFALLFPPGVAGAPKTGDSVIVAQSNDGGVCLGLRGSPPPEALSPGEVMLYAGEQARIHLKPDGTIHLWGRVFLNGEEWMGGA